MMRITNSMMSTNTKNNININKLNEDTINSQVATGQKILRPSDDPVIAIRALRLNTNLSQLNQYYEKNIPDAEAWLKTTETALAQTDVIFDHIIENLTTGASDDNTASDRQKILESLKGLKNEFYATGNADYADRTVFTGYRTGEALTFLSTDSDLDCNYRIHQNISLDDIDRIDYVTTADRTDATSAPKTYDEANVTSENIRRIRLPYDNLKVPATSTINITDGTTTLSAQVVSIAGKSQADIDDIYMAVSNDSVSHSPAAYFIPETGEFLLCTHAEQTLASAKGQLYVEYDKDSWETGDLRPEHYFACIKTEKNPDGTTKDVHYNYDEDKTTSPYTYTPNFQNQDIEIEIAFNQKITINTHASDVYKHDIGRDIDDFLKVTQDVVKVDEKLSKLESSLASASTEADKLAIQQEIDAAKKEFAYKRDKMQKTFSAGLDIFKEYADKNNIAFANVGSIEQRLEVTKERVADQLQSFKELADANININLTDAAIDLSNAGLALQAAQLAAGKIAQQTLLDYL